MGSIVANNNYLQVDDPMDFINGGSGRCEEKKKKKGKKRGEQKEENRGKKEKKGAQDCGGVVKLLRRG